MMLKVLIDISGKKNTNKWDVILQSYCHFFSIKLEWGNMGTAAVGSVNWCRHFGEQFSNTVYLNILINNY